MSTKAGDLLTSQQVADRLGITEDSVRRLRSQKKGPAYINWGNRIRYKPQDVEDWLDANRVENPS